MVGYYLQFRNKLGSFCIRLKGTCSGGDVVMLVMISSTFADTATAADFIGAFKEIAGTLSVEL